MIRICYGNLFEGNEIKLCRKNMFLLDLQIFFMFIWFYG